MSSIDASDLLFIVKDKLHTNPAVTENICLQACWLIMWAYPIYIALATLATPLQAWWHARRRTPGWDTSPSQVAHHHFCQVQPNLTIRYTDSAIPIDRYNNKLLTNHVGYSEKFGYKIITKLWFSFQGEGNVTVNSLWNKKMNVRPSELKPFYSKVHSYLTRASFNMTSFLCSCGNKTWHVFVFPWHALLTTVSVVPVFEQGNLS